MDAIFQQMADISPEVIQLAQGLVANDTNGVTTALKALPLAIAYLSRDDIKPRLFEESIRLLEYLRTSGKHKREEQEQIMVTLQELRGLQRALTQANRSVVLPRLHLFEFSDQAWLPAFVRAIITYVMAQGFLRAGATSWVGEVMASLIQESGTQSILELAAGSAKSSALLADELKGLGVAVSYVVSDNWPDIKAFRDAYTTTRGRVTYIKTPIDIHNIPCNLRGLRLLVRSFHHLKPEEAARFLEAACKCGVPIAIFETTDRRLLHTLLNGPLAVLFMLTGLPKILQVFSWRGAIWFLPATIVFAWDAFVSCLRSYSLAELALMTQPLKEYQWRTFIFPTRNPGTLITCLTGTGTAA